MKYEPIDPAILHAYWPKVRPGLERIKEKGCVHWIPEDVYAHLRFKLATLYIASGERDGFFVLERNNCSFSGGLVVNVWALYAEPRVGEHFADVSEFVGNAVSFIDGVAKGLGAKRVTCDGRGGWEKVLKDYFRPTLVHYERSL